MDLKEIKQIVDMMKRTDLTEFEIEEQGLKLRICRRSDESSVVTSYPQSQPLNYAVPVQTQVVTPEPAAPTGPVIKSPMVGTYYAAPSPDSPDFVSVGDRVNPESVVCIIEAMKVMNEIKAETSGTIAEILVQNGASVEYGQPLYRLK